MNIIQWIKSKLYFLKIWYQQLFLYPNLKYHDASYNMYWQSRQHPLCLNSWQRERADFVIHTLKHEINLGVVVDIGCGNGLVSLYLREKLPFQGCLGIDISRDMLQEAEKYGIKTIQADVTVQPELIPSGEYILIFEVLEHVVDSESLLNGALKKARKGVFFSFPNTGYFIYRLRLLFGRVPLQWRIHPGEHVRFWTKKDLLWWLKELDIREYTLHFYKGVPLLNKVWPALFAAGFVVYISKDI